jgi:fibro-slime domain-containing protein
MAVGVNPLFCGPDGSCCDELAMGELDDPNRVLRNRAVLLVVCVASACSEPAAPARPGAEGTGIASAIGTQGGSDGDDDDGDGDETADKLDVGVAASTGMINETAGEECENLQAILRDFQSSHPDFEVYTGDMAYTGLVMAALGADQTPAYNPNYAGPAMITSADTFADWYHDVAGVNQSFPVELALVEESPGYFVYDNGEFFLLDGLGFGDEGNPHNYHFTTEVHTSFTYQGGETFTFRGDDDLWMFVDGQLAMDLGGLHPVLEGVVNMDDFGLVPGETYPMDIFHAERHTDQSNFRIETTIECFTTPPPPG